MNRFWSLHGNHYKGIRPGPPGIQVAASAFSDGYDAFGYEGNESFVPASPTYKDGTPITGDALTYWDTASTAYLTATATSGNYQYVNPVHMVGNSSTYNSGRWGQNSLTNMQLSFRMTGDLRLLDVMVDAWNAAKTQERVSWNLYDCGLIDAAYSWMHCPVTTGDPWSPYVKFINYHQSGFYYGTDLPYLDTFKHALLMTEIAWILWVNRNKTSPGGVHDYAVEAAYWISRVEDFVKTWSEPETAGTWTDNYRGDQWNANRRRGLDGVWPFAFENGGHVAWQGGVLPRYLGLLGLHAGAAVTNPQGALDWVANDFAPTIRGLMVDCTGPWGDSLIVRADITDPTEIDVGAATYTGYQTAMMATLWMTGAYRDTFTYETMRKLALSYADMHNVDGSTKVDMLGGVGRCGLTSTATEGQSINDNAIKALTTPVIWEDRATTTRLKTAAEAVQASPSGGGGWTTPDSGYAAGSLFVQEALMAAGDL